MHIEVIQLVKMGQKRRIVDVEVGATIATVLEQLQITLMPGEAVGVFGQLHNLDYSLRADDRLEIYSPVLEDPKAKRVEKLKQKRWQGAKRRINGFV